MMVRFHQSINFEIILQFSLDHFNGFLETPNSIKSSKMEYNWWCNPFFREFPSFVPNLVSASHCNHESSPPSHEIHNTCHLKWEIFHTISRVAMIFFTRNLWLFTCLPLYQAGVYFKYKICCRDNLSFSDVIPEVISNLIQHFIYFRLESNTLTKTGN